MKLQSFILLVVAVVTLACPHPALAQTQFRDAGGRINHGALTRECKTPPYAVRFAGAAIQGNAEITAAALREHAPEVLGDLNIGADAPSLTAQARLEFTRRVVGGFAAAAFEDVSGNYFCRLRALYANDAERMAAIEAADAHFTVVYTRLFDSVLYAPGTEAYRLKREVLAELDASADALPVAFQRTELTGPQGAIPQIDFAGQTSLQGAFNAAGLGLGQLEVCGGLSFQSHRSYR